MGGVVTLIISLLAGAVVVTMTCEAPVAIVTVCGAVAVAAVNGRCRYYGYSMRRGSNGVWCACAIFAE